MTCTCTYMYVMAVCVSVLQLMCDEYEQKLDRLKALDKKIEELKQKQGEFNLSGTVYTHYIAFVIHIRNTALLIHVHVHIYISSLNVFTFTCTCKQSKARQSKWKHSRQTANFKEKKLNCPERDSNP